MEERKRHITEVQSHYQILMIRHAMMFIRITITVILIIIQMNNWNINNPRKILKIQTIQMEGQILNELKY